MSELIEMLAALEHERWSGWMEYLFTKGTLNEDGSFTIDAKSVRHWQGQILSHYLDLSEAEKESDRAEVRKVLAKLAEWRLSRPGP